MHNRGAKAAAIMIGYAVLLVLGGLIAFFMAPEGANAATAIIIPGACAVVMAVCAALAYRFPRSRRAGMIGIHLGIVFTLLFLVGIGARAWAATAGVAAYRSAVAEFRATDSEEAENQTLEAHLAARGLPDHDKAYLRNMLWGLAILSFLAFVALLLNRPRPEERGAASST